MMRNISLYKQKQNVNNAAYNALYSRSDLLTHEISPLQVKKHSYMREKNLKGLYALLPFLTLSKFTHSKYM